MSTTPTTSENPQPSYTVVGGIKHGADPGNSLPLSILLLNRGGRPFRPDLFEELSRLGAREVISLEGPRRAYDVESLSRKYPGLRFVLFHEELTPGEQINIGIREAVGDQVFVLWNDMKLQSSTISSRLIQKIIERHELCTVPLLLDEENQEIPTLMVPAFQGKKLRVVPFDSGRGGASTLFPFDYCGLYNRNRFLSLGGFDPEISSPYWQRMDFGFRGYLWGESIVLNKSLKIWYLTPPPAETAAADESYSRFYLKNLAVKFRRDSAYLPGVVYLRYLFRSRGGMMKALREFRRVRDWVYQYRYRFSQDSKGVIELWEMETGGEDSP